MTITRDMAKEITEDLVASVHKLTGKQCSRQQVKQTIRNLTRLLAHPDNGARCADFDSLVEFVRSTMVRP